MNSAIALRPSDEVIGTWARDHKLGDVLSMRSLEPHFAAIERGLGVRTVSDEVLGEHNRAFGVAAARIGVRAERLTRFERGCLGRAECLTGCRSGRKLGMNVSLVPRCLHGGARIYTCARVTQVEAHAGRARSVVARLGSGSALRVHARRGVVVCASALQTPGILRRSGVRSAAVGRHFQCHPGMSITARFDRPMRMQFGATQGFNSTHFSHTDRFKLESVSLPPELVAMNLPGCGPDLVQQLANYEQLVCWAVALRAEAVGRVVPLFGREHVWFTPTRVDLSRMRTALKVLSEMFFAIGAREVWPGVHGMPRSLRSVDDLRHWDSASLDPQAYRLVASHLFGTARMGVDPRHSAVGTHFETHAMRGLYVLDSSVFPTHLGVNPQHTIMAVARLGAERIAARG